MIICMRAAGSSSSATYTHHHSLSPQGIVSQHAVLLHALRNQWQLLTSCSSCGAGALHVRMCLRRHQLLLRGVGACVHVFVDICCNDISLFLRAEALWSAQASAKTAPTSTMWPRPRAWPGTTPPAACLAIALYANHIPLCSILCALAVLLRGHKPLVAAYAAERPTLPSRRLHGLVAAKLLRALRCPVLDST
jgi:hypothetical protein